MALPNGDAPKEYLTFRDFAGMNRQAIRTSIQRNEFSYLQNLMPVGHGNLQTVRTSLQVANMDQSTPTGTVGWTVNLDSLLITSVPTGGTFLIGETLVGQTTGTTGVVAAAPGTSKQLWQLGSVDGEFAVGEAVKGSLSSATATVESIQTNDFALVAKTDGSLWAANMAVTALLPSVQTTPGEAPFVQIAAAGTFIADVTAWSNTVALLVGPLGYYTWDGTGQITNLSTVTGATIDFTPAATAVFSAPATGTFVVGETVTGGSSGSKAVVGYYNAALTPPIYVTGVTAAFTAGETITGGTSGATANIVGPFLYPGPVQADFPGFTIGATLADIQNPSVSAKVLSQDLVADTVTVTNLVGVPVAGDVIATSSGGPFPITVYGIVNTVDTFAPPPRGSSIAVYQSRVWVSDGRNVSFSGPNDFSAPSWDVQLGSGVFENVDSSAKGPYTKLIAANGYLYLFLVNGIDVISNLYVPSGQSPPTPVFTRTNINAVIGTTYPFSVVVYDRVILFFNQFGVHVLSGVQVDRISAPIDLIIQELSSTPAGTVSASVGVCNNLLTATFLVSWFDPTVSTAAARQTLLSFFDGKWFLYDPLNVFPDGVIASVFSGTLLGNPVAPLIFNTPSMVAATKISLQLQFESDDKPIVRKMQTALWDLGMSIMTKQALRLGIEGQVINLAYNLQGQVDSESQSSELTTFLPNTFLWTDNNGNPFTWYSGPASNVFAWAAPGFVFAYHDATNYGKYLGATIAGTTGDAVISGVNLEYERRQRAVWAL